MNNDNRNDGGDKIAAVIVSKSVLVSWGQGGTNMQQEVAATLDIAALYFSQVWVVKYKGSI